MIKNTLSRKSSPAITSDRWHVVRARWSGETSGEPRFEREIVSEHDGRDSAVTAGRKVVASMRDEMTARLRDQRDQIFVRRPAYKSLKTAGRRLKKRRG